MLTSRSFIPLVIHSESHGLSDLNPTTISCSSLFQSPPLQSFKPPSSKSRSSRKSDTATTASSSTGGSHRGRVSNTDRDALEELKAIIRARDSRFTMKGPGVVGKKHHPFSSKDVPFPRYYDRAVLDQYVLSRFLR